MKDNSDNSRGITTWISPLWTDRTVSWLAVAGLALCILLFGYVYLVYPGLPASLPLHWNSQAQVDVIGDPQELLRLPAFASSSGSPTRSRLSGRCAARG